MSEDFGILGSSYRLLETHFEVDAIVLRARDVNNEQVVAIRTPNTRPDAQSERIAKFTRESEKLAAFDDPYILSAEFFASGVFDERCYLVSEWMDCTLEEFLRERQPLDHELATEILRQVLCSVRALSTAGVVHGTLAPRDFMVSLEDKAVKLGNFETSMERGDLLDRRPYVSPEVLESGSVLDQRSDIYSVGVIAYRLFLDKERFEIGLLNPSGKAETPTLNQLDARIGLGLSNVVEKMVHGDPKTRYRNAEDVIAALMDAKDVSNLQTLEQAMEPLAEQAATQQITPPRRQSRAWAMLSSLIGVGVVGAALFFGWQWHQNNQREQRIRTSLASTEQARQAALGTRADKPTATPSFAQAEQAAARAATALETGDFAGALRLASTAQTLYATAIEEALERSAGAARDAAQATRRRAVQAEASTTAEFEQADSYFSPAMHAFYEGEFEDAEQAFLAAKSGFETSIQVAGVEQVRRRVELLRSSVRHPKQEQDTPAIETGERLRAEGEAQLQAGDLDQARESFVAAEDAFATVIKRANARPVLVVREGAVRARHEAEHFDVGTLESFEQGLAQMKQADQALANDRFDEAQAGFEQARRDFELSRRQAAALTRKKEMHEARAAALAGSLSQQDPDVNNAARFAQSAETAFDESRYEQAGSLYEQATAAYRAVWATAVLADMRVLEKDAAAAKTAVEEAGGAELDAYRTGLGHFESAGRALRLADLKVAKEEFRAAQQQFEAAEAEALAIKARRQATQTRDRALGSPDPAGGGHYAEALAELETAERLFSEREFHEAASAFERAQQKFAATP